MKINFILGEDAIDATKEYVSESKKSANKKARETAEEASEAAIKKKRQAADL